MELGTNQKASLAALRGGEYKQGLGGLQSPVGFCCLGVGVDVIDKLGAVKAARSDDGMLLGICINDDEWKTLGLQDNAGYPKHYSDTGELVQLIPHANGTARPDGRPKKDGSMDLQALWKYNDNH